MYRILRHNKELGPYSFDELVQLNLGPYDLIWIEGRSASWRYPSEIDELKLFVPGTPTTETPSIAPGMPAPPPAIPKAEQQPPIESLEEPQEELTAAMLEQKANVLYQRIQDYNAKCEQDAQGIQTKYARSLEDLKQDYADWLHGKKGKQRGMSFSNRGWVAFGAVSAAFIIFLLAGKDKEIVWPNIIQKEKPAKLNETEAVNHAVTEQSNDALGGSADSQHAAVQSFIDSMRAVLRQQELANNRSIANSKASKRKIKISPPVTLSEAVLFPPEEQVVAKPTIKSADLDARYIAADNSSKIKEVQVTVLNTGTVPLKQVTVDVFYYKKGERFIDKETLFFTDIGPGNAYTVSKPGNRKAVTARFELGELTAAN